MEKLNAFQGCRICLQDTEELTSILSDENIAINLNLITQSINLCFDYAAMVCKSCQLELTNVISFREKVLTSDEYLRNNYNCEIDLEVPEAICEQEIESTIKDEKFENTTQCQQCLKIFTSLHSLKDHIRVIHEELTDKDLHSCHYCNRQFKIKYYLNRHLKKNHANEEKSKLHKKNSKERKVKSEQATSLLSCPYCLKCLTSKHSLNDHIRVKHEFTSFSERFLCDLCGKDFPLKYYLLRHIKSTHLRTNYQKKKKDNESLPCSICGKILRSKGNLSTHEKTHRILRPEEYWYCDLCGNKFKGRGEMTVHIKKRHLLKVQYPCEICPNKSWRTLFQLQRHIKVFHQNIREYKCEWCGKEFGEKNKLTCHVRIHTGEQPFECKYCDRKFTHQTDLRRHVWGHTGERKYKCEKCAKGYMKKSELLAHESRCHSTLLRCSTAIQIPFQYKML